MEKIKYSFLVANYNKGKNIEKCLKQLLVQNVTNFEIVVIDDCSTDDSVEVINKIKSNSSKINLHINEVNRGIGFTRNELLKLSKGEYIIFVDSDDYVVPNMLDYIEKKNNKNFDLIRYQNVVEPATENQTLIEKDKDKYRFCCSEKGIINPNEIIIEWCTNPYCANALLWSYCIKKSLFEKNNIKFPNLTFHEDFAVVPLLLSHSNEILVIEDVLYHYLQYDKSITKLKNQKMNFNEKKRFYSNKYSQYKLATMNIINGLNSSFLKDDVKSEMKTNLLMRLEKRYEKYTNILREEFGGKYEESCLFER